MSPEQQRMLWLSATAFGDDGSNFRAQERRSTAQSWALGIEQLGRPTFAAIYERWCRQ